MTGAGSVPAAASNPTCPCPVSQLCPRSPRDQASCTGLPTCQGRHCQGGEAAENQ